MMNLYYMKFDERDRDISSSEDEYNDGTIKSDD
jgi:hypothetical protein